MADDTTGTETDQDGPAETATDWQAEAAKWQALSRKNEERAKANSSAAKELEQLRQSRMTENEKAVAEAERRGRLAGAERLAKAELRATAAGRVPKDALDGFLEFADMKRFLAEDGEPDTKAIEAAVKKLGGTDRATDYDGGARTSAGKAPDMNNLIRRAAGHG